jgi:hypothetical protein
VTVTEALLAVAGLNHCLPAACSPGLLVCFWHRVPLDPCASLRLQRTVHGGIARSVFVHIMRGNDDTQPGPELGTRAPG